MIGKWLGIGVAVLVALPGIVPAQERSQVQSFKSLESRYLNQRKEIAPLAPPFSAEAVDAFAAMILKGDYSFQNLDGWYYSWADQPCAAEGSLAAYAGQTLVVFEDLAAGMTRIATPDGKTLASFKAEPWPNLAGLTGADYERALLNELNRRSVALWVSFKSASAPLAASSSGSGGGMMMLMGGETEMEVVDIGATNNGMAVTFAWPQGTFTNRLDIYSFDGGGYNGFGSWKLAEIGYSTIGTNRLRWLDSGQLGRGLPTDAEVRLYTGGSDKDSDGDGYSDSFEQLTLNSNPTNGDTDADGVSDGPFDPDNTGSIVAGPDAFPLDASEWLDTDGDGIGDNADTDDDGDGIADTNETTTLQRLMPITTAPFRVVTVESTDPAGDDSGTEVFDVSSAAGCCPTRRAGTRGDKARFTAGYSSTTMKPISMSASRVSRRTASIP